MQPFILSEVNFGQIEFYNEEKKFAFVTTKKGSKHTLIPGGRKAIMAMNGRIFWNNYQNFRLPKKDDEIVFITEEKDLKRIKIWAFVDEFPDPLKRFCHDHQPRTITALNRSIDENTHNNLKTIHITTTRRSGEKKTQSITIPNKFPTNNDLFHKDCCVTYLSRWQCTRNSSCLTESCLLPDDRKKQFLRNITDEFYYNDPFSLKPLEDSDEVLFLQVTINYMSYIIVGLGKNQKANFILLRRPDNLVNYHDQNDLSVWGVSVWRDEDSVYLRPYDNGWRYSPSLETNGRSTTIIVAAEPVSLQAVPYPL